MKNERIPSSNYMGGKRGQLFPIEYTFMEPIDRIGRTPHTRKKASNKKEKENCSEFKF